MGDAFDSAALYTVNDDAERLHCETASEAIAEHLEMMAEPTADMEALIRGSAPLTVYGYKRVPVSDVWIATSADHLAERFVESFEEEYGDPDGYVEAMSAETVKALAVAITPAVRDAVAKSRVWSCEQVGERTFDADTLVTMMREACPEWWERGGSDGE